MITESEYLKAKAIVEEYERDQFEDGTREAEEELNQFDEQDEDDIEEERQNDLACRAYSCTCGAWTFNKDKTKVLHVADCICGAE